MWPMCVIDPVSRIFFTWLMKKSGLQSVPWLVMHICWLKGDYEVGYIFFFLGQLLVVCLEFSTKFASVNQPFTVLGSPFIFTPSVTM